MAYPLPLPFPASYADVINAREGPLIKYIYHCVTDQRFADSFSRFFGITPNNIRSANNLAFVSAIITGSLWGNHYFNTDFEEHRALFGLNCNILHNERCHCEKLLTWMFRILNTAWTKLSVTLFQGAEFAGNITDLSIIGSIIEELRLVHLDEDGLTQCVSKLANQLSLAFHAIHVNVNVNVNVNPPALLPQAMNA